MRIAFVLPGRGFSGGVRCGVRMASELMRRGHGVKILYRRGTFGMRFVAGKLYRKLVVMTPKDWVAQFNGNYASFKNLTAKLVGEGDAVIAVGPDCVEEMTGLPERCGVKVFNVHGITLRDSYLRQTAWSKNIPKIVVSNHVREEMCKAGGGNIVAVVPNGIDTEEYFPDNVLKDRLAVGTVYGSGIAKDPQTILSVFAILHKLRPNLPLMCFSSEHRPGELTRAVQYKYLPTVAEARRLYSKCAVWFCASRSEGFGLPLLEAMACGCAVVSTDCGGPNDYLKSGVNGIVVEKEAPTKMVDEILKVIDDKSKRTQIANNALETVKTLSWPSAACKMEAALKSILSGQQR